ncbi:MAG: putative DNA binding domain-containing protein [Bacteroidetes bacterium]|nr:putative DNA binding domain-containing protein [Bacteroidota bacterium]MCY4233127.1 putative DNA binding domain-containing protein [Bacteroidota bacterium]
MPTVKNIPLLVKRLCQLPEETDWVEFKSNDADPIQLGKNISAIANAVAVSGRSHGYIIWGIHDHDHRIIGTAFNPATKLVQKDNLDHWLANRLKPSVNLRFYQENIDDKTVVVLVIPHALNQPVRFNHEAYIRIGSHTRDLNHFPEKERILWRISESRIFEKATAIEYVKDKDVMKLLDYEFYFKHEKIPVPTHVPALLQQLQLEDFIHQRDDGAWDILNLGFLSIAHDFSDAPSLRHKAIRVVTYNGSGRHHESRQEEFMVGYASGFSKFIQFVDHVIPTDETFRNGIRKQSQRFPILAVREVIANAMIHQDLSSRNGGPIVEIFDNRIEVMNRGIPLIDCKQFINAPPKTRNKTLATLFRRFGMCEELGSGWDKIVDEIEKFHLPAPKVELMDDCTRVTIYAYRPLSEIDFDDRIRGVYQHACLTYISKGRGITESSIQQRFGLSNEDNNQVSELLRQALDAGDIAIKHPHVQQPDLQYIPFWAIQSENDYMDLATLS